MVKTLLGVFLPLSCYCMDETQCLAQNIYFEARGESLTGQLAVAYTTLNRVVSDRFPDTVCEVVWQPRQFSWTHDGKSDAPKQTKLELKAWEQSNLLSSFVIHAWPILKFFDPTKGSTYYHSKQVMPFWSYHYEPSVVIGEHIFYTE